ncbi:MAG: DTW domain-containing protein [Hydrogenophaga sp.]|uniref:tRNA-uridine aminocarboxypropyltransferase n=1 Tax=Hydrogenophaga sp. TaxID=1904254 RepID=UPI001D96D20C|nr:tRNA-uridine aminocarboxypropyltransferase [Hydrogenophaga sp.]MBX3611922.1 DTW domain-containing protein [Hydrogenophaga sp.]
MPHAVARLRAQRLAASTKPFKARGGTLVRCAGCRLPASHCICALRPTLHSRAGMCLLMGDIEALKPSNTGWLIADLVPDTWAFAWSRTQVDSALLALLADPQWQPVVVFPGEFVPPERVITALPAATLSDSAQAPARRPLFVLLDGTWSEARKMFNKSPWLNALPVLSLQPGQASQYRLRRSSRDDHFCTAEVAAFCLALAGEVHAGQLLQAWFEVFSAHYLSARQNRAVVRDSAVHARLAELASPRACNRAMDQS